MNQSKETHTLEKSVSSVEQQLEPVSSDQHHFDATDLDGVQRRLKQRHVQMYVFLSATFFDLLTNFGIKDCCLFLIFEHFTFKPNPHLF